MECTQRLECSQELYNQIDKISPEQIGFLGICGTKYPVTKGPNKIGRDPQTCNIVLNLNSISRQHAVINILNQREFMLMDLDSANKTKLLGKTLQPYMPHPLTNGDTVQFGDIFGIFRLLEEDDDLPMTQAIDIPETPVHTRHISKLNHAPVTMIPESPDVSDRDDSFIIPSQPKAEKPFKSTNNQHFIKPSKKTISIQPIGSKKIDNVYWNSLRKSKSISLHSNESNKSLNTSIESNSVNNQNDHDIHDMETQAPCPNLNESTDSIYTAETQAPGESHALPSIHSLETQPPTTEHLPEVRKIHGLNEMRLDLYAANKENDNSIFNAETQLFQTTPNTKKNIKENKNSSSSSPRGTDSVTSKRKSGTSDEELLFDEIDSQPFRDDFESQCLLPEDKVLPVIPNKTNTDNNIDEEIDANKPSRRITRSISGSSTDCDDFDILPTQKIPEQKIDDDTTDCEEELNDINKNKPKNNNNPSTESKPQITFEDMPTQLIVVDEVAAKQADVCFEDMLTQVIDVVDNKEGAIDISKIPESEQDFEDLATQVIDEVIPNNSERIEYETQQYSEDIVSPFKIPLQSLIKGKRKDISKPTGKSILTETKTASSVSNFYESTQDMYNDLCSQSDFSPEIVVNNESKKKSSESDDKLAPCFVENYKTGKRYPHIENKVPKNFVSETSPSTSEGENKVNRFVTSLSKEQIRDVIGVNSVTKIKKTPSDSSDVDATPKKVRPLNFMEIDLPNSQEIKNNIYFGSKLVVTESSSESETENNTEENTPILFCKKKKPKVKIDLTRKFDVEALPARVITRVRKPTSKMQDSENNNKKTTTNILKPQFLIEQEDDIDKEIICENISRLKTKNEKSQNSKEYKNSKKSDKIKAEGSTSKPDYLENSNKKEEKVYLPKHKHIESHKRQDKSLELLNKITDNDDKNVEIKNVDSLGVKIQNKSTRSSRNKIKNNEIKSISPQLSNNHNKKNESKRRKPEPSVSQTTNKNKDPVDLIIDTKKSCRSTRRARNADKDVKKSSSPEQDSQKEVPKRKRTQKKKDKELLPNKEVEVRRSERQRATKVKKDSDSANKDEIKSILKKTIHEQSTVYNISSGSSADSPKSLKRLAVDDSGVPSPKRARPMGSNNSLLRSTPARSVKIQYVLFTAFPYEEVKVKLGDLGAVVIADVMQCTAVLTLQIKRTFKLLCAVGLGRPIVGPDWVQACSDNNMIVDPWLYIIKDSAAEKRFQFSLERTLTGKRNFLMGCNVSSTPGVMPTASEMKLIVECSGGTWKEEGPRWVCVSCPADKALWPSLRRRGATIVTTEFILGGVLRQKLDIQGNQFH